MTRAAVFSDTHGRTEGAPEAIRQAGGIGAILHLGDYGGDLQKLADSLSVPYYAVRGNCDYFGNYPRKRIVTIENASLLMVHGDAFRSVFELSDAAKKDHCAAVLFGHTHEPLLQADGETLILNPGSFSRPRFGSKRSFAVLEIDGGEIKVKMIPL